MKYSSSFCKKKKAHGLDCYFELEMAEINVQFITGCKIKKYMKLKDYLVLRYN